MSTMIARKLTAAGINLESVTIRSTREVEVAVMVNGECDRSKTERVRRQVAKALGWGGFRCAWGGWVLRKGYAAAGDWNDRASRCHY